MACGWGSYKDSYTTYTGHFVNDVWQGFLIYSSSGITDYRECKDNGVHGKVTQYDGKIITNKLYNNNFPRMKKEVKMMEAFFDDKGAVLKASDPDWYRFITDKPV